MENELTEKLEIFFKPESRSAGRALFAKGVVFVTQLSDTEVQGVIRSTSPLRVSYRSPSMGSPSLAVSCSCPIAKKGQLCRHAWASLLEIAKSRPDFLDGKTEIAPGASTEAAGASARVKSPSQTAAADSLRERQNAYRKEQYQKHKRRLKGDKPSKLSRAPEPELPEDIADALSYFADNGFPMAPPFQADVVQVAKKKLSRVFHPDKGGTHEEILALNHNCEIMLEFISTL